MEVNKTYKDFEELHKDLVQQKDKEREEEVKKKEAVIK